MTPDWESEGVQLYCGDCTEILPHLPDGCVDAVVADPPYNIQKADWDSIPEYFSWCDSWISLSSRACKRQGAFWCFHARPLALAEISALVEKHGRPLRNWITWDKYNGDDRLHGYLEGFTVVGGLRSFQQMAEYIVYQADDGLWKGQSDELGEFIFEPLRAYLCAEWERAGLTREQANEACGTSSMAGRHFFARSQWCLPTKEHYFALRQFANSRGGDYLRREYEDLRPTFNNPGGVSSVWQFPVAHRSGHETPKPVGLMARIVETTTNPGDWVCDPMMGAGTTGVSCVQSGRRFVGIEIEPKYFELACRRIEAAQVGLTPQSVAAGQGALFDGEEA